MFLASLMPPRMHKIFCNVRWFEHDRCFPAKQMPCPQSSLRVVQSSIKGFSKDHPVCLGQPDIRMDPTTYASLLRFCGNSKAFSAGQCVHAHMMQNGCERKVFLGTLLVQTYCNCGSVEDARALFFIMDERNVYLWNFMIGAYAQIGQFDQSFFFFGVMQREGMLPNKITFVYILSACASQGTLADGKRIHGRIMGTEIESDIVVATGLVSMYGRCGSLENARAIFDRIAKKNVVSWNAMISEYVQHGCGHEALHLFHKMQQKGVIPDKITFISVLSLCARRMSLIAGKHAHSCILCSGLESDAAVATALVNMYGKCKSIEDAQRSFEKMQNQDAITWNAIIDAYADHGYANMAQQLFYQMQNQGLIPTKVTYVNVLDGQAALAKGKQMHACIQHSGFEQNVVLGTALVSMYGRCKSLTDAQNMFERMRERNNVSWNAIIAVCAQHGQGQRALELFREMQEEGVTPGKLTFISTLDACASQAALNEGRQIHICITKDDLDLDVVVANALINLYGKCMILEDAQKIFEKMPVRSVVSWNVLMATYSDHGHLDEVFQMFYQMHLEQLIPDEITFLSVLSACACQTGLMEGKHVHSCIITMGLESALTIVNALINMYGEDTSLKDARKMFDSLLEKNVFSWNAMIKAYAHHGDSREIVLLFDQMQLEGVVPDQFSFACFLSTCDKLASLTKGKHLHTQIMHSGIESDDTVATALVHMYGKIGWVDDARTIFDKMSKLDIILWNAMISAYARSNRYKDVLQLFNQMHLEGLIPNNVTCISILSACASHSALTEGKYVHVQVTHNGFGSDVVVATALVNMYGKCGSLHDAQTTFDRMSEWNFFSWNTLISAYAQHGHGQTTLCMYDQMQWEGLIPDKITFISVLSACSRSGLVDEAHQCLGAMNQVYGIKVAAKHYECIIDLFGRAGQLEDAEFLIDHMPFQPSAISWTSFLGACWTQDDMLRGERVVGHMLELNPHEALPNVIASRMYGASNRVIM